MFLKHDIKSGDQQTASHYILSVIQGKRAGRWNIRSMAKIKLSSYVTTQLKTSLRNSKDDKYLDQFFLVFLFLTP